MLDKGVKKFIIVFINIVHAEMRKKATPLSQRESYSLKDFYKKLLGLTRSICGKPQRIGCVKAFQSGIFFKCKLGGNTENFVPLKTRFSVFLSLSQQKN